MSRSTKPPLEPSEVPYAIFRAAATPALVAAAGCLVFASLGWGRQGLLGSLVGTVIVISFYWTDLAILGVAEKMDPKAMFGLFIGEYLIKVLLLAGLFAAMQDVSAIDVRMMGMTVGVTAGVWTMALAIAAARVRTFVVADQGGSKSPERP